MKKLLYFIAILLIILTTYIIYLNVSEVINLNINHVSLPFNLALYTSIIFITGIITGAIILGVSYFSQKDTINAYKRKLEKTSIEETSSSSKVEILEAKIITLEKALQNALKK